jgi:hypothetical protein
MSIGMQGCFARRPSAPGLRALAGTATLAVAGGCWLVESVSPSSGAVDASTGDVTPPGDSSPDAIPDVGADARGDAAGEAAVEGAAGCGPTNKDCLGGACIAGMCAPVVLATNQDHPGDIVVDDAGVYWVDEGDGGPNGSVMVEYEAGVPVTLVSGEQFPLEVGVDGYDIYWTARQSGLVERVAKGCTPPCTPEVVATGQGHPWGLSLDATSVWWTTHDSPGAVLRTLKAAGTPCGASTPCTVFQSGLADPAGLAGDATGIYWAETDAGAIRGANKDGTLPTNYQEGLTSPTWLTIDSATIYWSQYTPTPAIVGASTRDGTDGWTLATLTASRVAVDDQYLYITDRGGGHGIWRVQKGKSHAQPEQIASGQTYPYGITVDDVAVYWTDTVGGTVMKLAK